MKKIGIGIGIIIVGFFVLVIVVGVSVLKEMEEQTQPTSEPTIGDTISGKKVEKFGIGEIVEVAGIAYKAGTPITDSGTSLEKPDGIFFKIPFQIENLRDKTASISNDQFILIDEIGRQFDSTPAIFISNSLFLEDVQPNLPMQRFVVFDIPLDTTLQYNVQIRPGLFEISTDEVLICVKNC